LNIFLERDHESRDVERELWALVHEILLSGFVDNASKINGTPP
jgi:hypothetical protein